MGRQRFLRETRGRGGLLVVLVNAVFFFQGGSGKLKVPKHHKLDFEQYGGLISSALHVQVPFMQTDVLDHSKKECY